MADAKFYHIYITPNVGASIESIKTQMDLSPDWFKYGRNNWIIYSGTSIKKLMLRFKPLVEPNGQLFICELNISNRTGFMPKDFWEWVRKKRDE
jgi:hypothetical protein